MGGDDEREISWLPIPDEETLPEGVRELFGRAREKLGFLPNVFRFFSLRPEHLVKWRAHYDELLRGESGLTPAQREMIAVVVSAQNRCYYWLTTHGAALRELTEDPILVDQLMVNHRDAERLSAKERAMLDFALKVTLESHRCSPADLAVLREAGWSDEDLFDIAEVTAMFNLTNRMASALGWMPNEEYHRLGR